MRALRESLRLQAALRIRRIGTRCGVVAVAGLLATAAAMLGPAASALSPTPVAADSTFDSTMLSLLNQDRASHGLGPLQSSASLGALAENSTYTGCGFSVSGRAEDMIQRNYLSHTILNCGSQNVFNIMRADGVAFSGAAENIGYATGFTDPAAAARWMNSQFMQSPEHEGNILNGSYNQVGIGSWWSAPGQTWTGAGSAMNNVIVGAVEFIQSPNAAPAPTHSAPPPPAPSPVHRASAPSSGVHAAAAAPRTAATAAAGAARAATTGVAVVDGPAIPNMVETGAYPLPDVPAAVGHNVARLPVSAELTCAAVILAAAGSLRRRVARHRARRRAGAV